MRAYPGTVRRAPGSTVDLFVGEAPRRWHSVGPPPGGATAQS